MIVIFLSTADIKKKYPHYMKRTGVLQIRVTVTATYQQHEHIITKSPSWIHQLFQVPHNYIKPMSSVGSSSRFNI